MGESYKGLTIKFGGDTTDLRNALKGVSSAISDAQSHARRLDKALRMDPGSADLAARKVEEVGRQASGSRVKLAELRALLSRVDAAGVTKAAEGVRNAALEAERANQAYNAVNAELERMNRGFASIAKARGMDVKKMDARAVVEALREAGEVSDDLYSKYNRLAEAHGRLQETYESAKAVAQLHDLRVEMATTESESRSLARSVAELESSSGSGGALSARIKAVGDYSAEAASRARSLSDEFARLDRALELDPSNVEAASERTRVLAERAKEARERYDGLKGKIRELESAVGKLGDSVSTLDLDGEVEEAQRAYVGLRVRVGDAEAAVDSLRQEMMALEAKDDLGDRYRELGTRVEAARGEVSRLNDEMRASREALDTARARRELRELSEAAAAARSDVASIDAQMRGSDGAGSWAWRSLGVSLSSNLTPQLMAVGYAAASSAEETDAAFRDMAKTVNGTQEQFEGLRAAAIDYSQTHVTSAATILEIEAMGGQLGIAADKLEEFAVVASNLDIATNLDADEISQAMGQLSNVMHWGEGDMQRFGDALVRLGNNMPAQEDAIVDITKRIGAAGTMYGMTTPQVLSWATAIASTGQNCEAAGTAVSNSLSDIENAVAAGGDGLAAFAEVAGMLPEEFAALWSADASSAFEAFVSGLARIEAEGGSADVALSNLGITGVRQKQALKGLSQTVDVLSDSLAMSQDAWDGVSDRWGDAGDAAREAERKSEGLSGAMAIMRNNFAALFDELGEGLLPFVKILSDAAGGLADALEKVSPGWKALIVAVGGAAAAAGPAVNVLSSLSNVIGRVGKAGASYGTLSKVGTALSKVGKFGGPAAAVLALVGTCIADAAERSRDFKKATEGLVDAVSRPIVGEASGALDGYAASASDAAVATDDFIEAQARLAEEISGRHAGMESDNALLDEVGGTIASLAERSDLTADELGRLNAAVDILNDACGTSYTVAQDSAGAYQVMADGAKVAKGDILELVEAMQLQAATEVYMEDYKDLLKQRREADEAHASKVAELVREEQALAELEAGQGERSWKFSGDSTNVNLQRHRVEELREDVAELGIAAGSAAKALDLADAAYAALTSASQGNPFAKIVYDQAATVQAAFEGTEYTLMDLVYWIGQTGISADQLAEDSGVSMWQLATDFGGSTQSVISSLVAMSGASEEQMAALAACFDGEGNGVAESLYAFAEQLRESGLDSAAEYVRAFADTLAASAQQAQEASQTVADAAVQGAETGEDGMGDAGGDAGGSYTDAVEGTSGDAESAGRSMAESAVAGAASVDASGAGSDLAAGFAAGIGRSAYLAADEARAMARDAAAAAREELDEHSPSRVGREIGEFFSIGAALGIADGASRAESAARGMAETAAAAARAASQAASFGDSARGVAASVASAARTGWGGPTKADIYDAVRAAVAGGGVAVYVDGRRLSRALAPSMDAELGAYGTRRQR